MTKREIALVLAKQLVEAEKRMFEFSDKYKEAKDSNPNMDRNEKTWYRGVIHGHRESISTIRDSKKLLGISDKTWSNALDVAYIENSKKERELV